MDLFLSKLEDLERRYALDYSANLAASFPQSKFIVPMQLKGDPLKVLK